MKKGLILARIAEGAGLNKVGEGRILESGSAPDGSKVGSKAYLRRLRRCSISLYLERSCFFK